MIAASRSDFLVTQLHRADGSGDGNAAIALDPKWLKRDRLVEAADQHIEIAADNGRGANRRAAMGAFECVGRMSFDGATTAQTSTPALV